MVAAILPTIHDIQDDPDSHGTSLREIKNAIEQIEGTRDGILMVFSRTFVLNFDPQKLPDFKGGADKWLRTGDFWVDITQPGNIKLKYWDARTKTWQLIQ